MHSNAKYTSHLRQRPDNQLQYILVSCYMMRIHLSMHIIYIVHAIHIQHLIYLVSFVSYQLNLIVPFSCFASISIRVLHIIRGLCDFPALGAAAACVEHCGKTKLSVGSLVHWFVRCLGFLFHTKRLVEHLKIPLLVFPGIMKVNILKNKREWTHEIICQFLSLLGQAMILW